jgi:hypothetical protein
MLANSSDGTGLTNSVAEQETAANSDFPDTSQYIGADAVEGEKTRT